MKEDEYVCIRYYHIDNTRQFIPNMIYIFKEKFEYKGTEYEYKNFYNFQMKYSIGDILFQHYFMLKKNWDREQKLNFLLNN